MKILLFCARFPFPAIGGDRVQALNYLKGMAQYHDVSLYSVMDSSETADIEGLRAEIPNLGEIAIDKISKKDFLRGLAQSVLTLNPLQKYLYFNKSISKRFQKLSANFDVVMYFPFRLSVYGKYSSSRKNIVCFPDSFSLRYKRSIGFQGAVKNLIYKYESSRLYSYERAIINQFDASIFINNEDLEFLKCSSDKTWVLANGTHFLDSVQVDRESQVITFLGKMDYYPNELTAIDIINNVFPKIKQRFPRARLVIIGANPSERLLSYANTEDVLITGRVTNPFDYLNGSSVFLAPMVIATGLQNKIIEAAGVGIPVITNDYGFSGLDMEQGREIIVENDYEGIVRQIERLFNDEAYYNQISCAGRKAIVEKYSWPKVWKDLNCVITDTP